MTMQLFNSPYDQYKERNGQHCAIIRELNDQEKDAEVGTMYKIKFQDGTIIDSWPEELQTI